MLTGTALLLASGLHLWRLVRWRGHRTGAEPLVLALHVDYAFVPLGASALGMAILWPDAVDVAAAQDVWMAGAIGLMTLAVMTRATLGHTGQSLTADTGTVAIYLLVIISVLARFLAGPMPALAPVLYTVSGVTWIAAFGSFSIRYGGYLLRHKPKE